MNQEDALFVVCFLLRNSPASDLYMPTFRNTLPVPSSKAFEDGTDRVFRNVGIYKSDAGKSPKRKQKTKLLVIISVNFNIKFYYYKSYILHLSDIEAYMIMQRENLLAALPVNNFKVHVSVTSEVFAKFSLVFK